MEREIELGDKVRCKITGFEGIAVEKSEFINGCVQYAVLPKCKGKEKDKIPDAVAIDEGSLEIIEDPKKKKVKKSETGGPMRKVNPRRNY